MATAPQAKSTLAVIVQKINSLNTGLVEGMVASGKLLIEAKARLKKETGGKRGGFQEWIKRNLKITPQTATRYMRLAKARNPLKTYGAQTARRTKPQVKGNAAAPVWAKMSPMNRAKTAFNALEATNRTEFLKWLSERLDQEDAKLTARPIRTPARSVSMVQQAVT